MREENLHTHTHTFFMAGISSQERQRQPGCKHSSVSVLRLPLWEFRTLLSTGNLHPCVEISDVWRAHLDNSNPNKPPLPADAWALLPVMTTGINIVEKQLSPSFSAYTARQHPSLMKRNATHLPPDGRTEAHSQGYTTRSSYARPLASAPPENLLDIQGWRSPPQIH